MNSCCSTSRFPRRTRSSMPRKQSEPSGCVIRDSYWQSAGRGRLQPLFSAGVRALATSVNTPTRHPCRPFDFNSCYSVALFHLIKRHTGHGFFFHRVESVPQLHHLETCLLFPLPPRDAPTSAASSTITRHLYCLLRLSGIPSSFSNKLPCCSSTSRIADLTDVPTFEEPHLDISSAYRIDFLTSILRVISNNAIRHSCPSADCFDLVREWGIPLFQEGHLACLFGTAHKDPSEEVVVGSV